MRLEASIILKLENAILGIRKYGLCLINASGIWLIRESSIFK